MLLPAETNVTKKCSVFDLIEKRKKRASSTTAMPALKRTSYAHNLPPTSPTVPVGTKADAPLPAQKRHVASPSGQSIVPCAGLGLHFPTDCGAESAPALPLLEELLLPAFKASLEERQLQGVLEAQVSSVFSVRS